MQKAVKHFFCFLKLKKMESDDLHNNVSKKIFDFSYNTDFDIIDEFVDGIVCIQQNAVDKFCPVMKVKFSHDNDKHELWLTKETKIFLKEKKNCIISIS